ncbi:ty3-gypsy retrotransposon protein, partial [Tanacetum coccineum]
GYASVAAPLTDLLKHEGFKWGDAEAQAFETLKQQLSHAPLLNLPNFDQVFVVEADASGDGIGAVLMQGNRPISYFSRKLGPRMRVAATYQKELFAIVEAVYKWRQYLLGQRFTIRTDHKSIKELMQQVIQTPLQQKYVRKLMGFDFDIEYKPGATNQAADALSRVFEEAEQVTAAFLAFSQPLVGFIGDLRGENETLAELLEIHGKMNNGEVLSGFRRENGLLIYNNRYFLGQESKLKTLLLREFHDTPSAGHGGIKKTLVGLSALFFWKGMRKSVEEFIKKCVVCQQTKYSTEAPGGQFEVGNTWIIKFCSSDSHSSAENMLENRSVKGFNSFVGFEVAKYLWFTLGKKLCGIVEKAEKVRIMFEQFDLNGDGGLDKRELGILLGKKTPHIEALEEVRSYVDKVFRWYAKYIDGDKGLTCDGLLRTYDHGIDSLDVDFETLVLELRTSTETENASRKKDR